MALETLKSFSSILDEDTEQSAARGSDVGFSDYLLDVPIGAVQGLSQAVQGLLQIGAMPIDYLANTNLLNGINNLFEKITPDTTTAVGDITSIITQFWCSLCRSFKDSKWDR